MALGYTEVPLYEQTESTKRKKMKRILNTTTEGNLFFDLDHGKGVSEIHRQRSESGGRRPTNAKRITGKRRGSRGTGGKTQGE